MAQRTVVHLEDDLDGSEAAETVSFALDGTSYEIDLSEQNAAEMRDVLGRYVGVARKGGGGAPRAVRASSAPRPRSSSEVDPKAVRAWAEANGVSVNARGRLKAEVIEQYKAANN